MNVLVLALDNSLRAIVKEMEHLSDDKIIEVNIASGEVSQNTFDARLFPILEKILR